MTTLVPTSDLDAAVAHRALATLRPLARYHRHKVVGLERIPTAGSAMLVMNHSLATYDILLLGAAVYQHRRRFVRTLVDRALMSVPVASEVVAALGGVNASPDAAVQLLQAGDLLGVAPGGTREALLPSRHRYELAWERRKGFARVAIRTGAPIVPVACPRADELYEVVRNPLTRFVYDTLRMPFPIAVGRFGTAIPRAIPLTHHIGEPIAPPPYVEHTFQSDVDALHAKVHGTMQALMDQALLED